jgi:cyanate permease
MQPLAAPPDETRWRYEGWRVVVACFCMAVFGWGLGFYGHSVYLAELQRIHGWPATWIATATTGFYLLGALFVAFISEAMRVLGPRVCLLAGIACMATATVALGQITAPWQLYVVYVVMALGWAGTSLGTITTALGLWFDRRRGMAISLALNGASCGGIVGVPLLVLAIGAFGFAGAVLAAGVAMVALLVPLIVICVGQPPVTLRADAPGDVQAAIAPRRVRAEALRSVAFLSVTVAFSLVLFAQVGVIVHLVSCLDPLVGRDHAAVAIAIMTAMAVVGRLALSTIIDRLNQRLASALSFASQAVALVVLINAREVGPIYAAAALFGFSVGNLITLPALIIQREFDAAAFGVLVSLLTAISQVTYSFGPGIVGLLRDLSGGYAVPFAMCVGLQLVAAALVMVRGRPRVARSCD